MAPLTPSSALLFGAALGSTAGECPGKSSSAPRRPRILVVGAGPTGIEAAVSCSLAGLGVTLCEKGDIIGHAVRDWGHVRLFSSNSLNCSPAGLRALADLGLAPPDPATYPTGDELCETYLEPLAKWLAQREDCEILLGARVESITRGGLLKGEAIKAAGSEARAATAFSALLDVHGEETLVEGLAGVIDASGTYGRGNFLGRGGAPALGERKLRAAAAAGAASAAAASAAPPADSPPRDFFFDRLPDVLARDRASFLPASAPAGVSVVLVGGGYSAATTLRALVDLAKDGDFPLRVVWLLRKPSSAGPPYAVVPDDPLPARGALVAFANALAAGGAETGRASVAVRRGASVRAVRRDDDSGGVVVEGVCEAAGGGGGRSLLSARSASFRTLVFVQTTSWPGSCRSTSATRAKDR